MHSSQKSISLTLLSSIAVQLCNVLVALLVPRIIIETYGSDMNGIVAAARQFSLYLALMEMSITAATCYRFIEFKKNNNYERINDLFVTIGGFYKKVGIIISGIAIVIALFYAITSKSQVNVLTIAVLFLLYESIYVISYFVYDKYNYILFSNGKQYFIAFGTVISASIAAGVKYFIAIKHLHIIILIAAGVCIDIVRLEVIRRKVKHDYPYLDIQKGKIDKTLLEQKWDSLVMSISDSVKSMIPILCISIGYGSQFVSVFSVYQTVMHLGTSIITMCSNGLLPVLGMRFTDGNDKASKSFRQLTIIVFAVGTIISSCFCGMILNFIRLYIGSGSDISYIYPVLGLLLVTNTWLLMARAPFDILIKAHGRIRELRDGCIIEIVITVAVCIIMSLFHRFELIVIGVVISSFYRVLRMILFCSKELKILPPGIIIKDFVLWLVFAAIVGGCLFVYIPSTQGIISFIKYVILELSIAILVSIAYMLILYPQVVNELRKRIKSI